MKYDDFIERLENDIVYRNAIAELCKADFICYLKTMFFIVNGTYFMFKPFHKLIAQKLQAIVEQKNKKRNLALCLPVGSGKSLIIEYFITWCFSRSVNNAFCYVSHSDRLITKLSKECKDIIEHPLWLLLFNNRLKKDDRQRVNFSFEGAKNRTGLTAGAMGSAITGLDAGNPNIKGFSGALICFPYNQKVWTNKGKIPIGDIVTNKLDVKIYSYNFTTNEVELKEIDNYITNPGDDILRVSLQNGTYIECTPTHKIWTQRGYVEAKDLISGVDMVLTLSNPLDLIKCQARHFHNIVTRKIFVSDKFKFFRRQFKFFPDFINNVTRKIFKRFFSFNCLDSTDATIKRFCNFFKTSGIFSNIDNIGWSKFRTRKNQSSEFYGVLHIFRFSSIAQIFKSIIKRIRVKMSDFITWLLNAYKGTHNKLMNAKVFGLPVFEKLDIFIALIYTTLQNLFGQIITAFIIRYPMFQSFYNTCIRYLINSFKTRYILINNVSIVGHNDRSYCLTVHNNHNLFIGESQAILAKNCDDPIDAGNARYDNARNEVIIYYDDKLATRRRTPQTPSILIMQRLHRDDLVGWIEKNEPDFWDIVKVPAIENGKSFWEERYPVAELKQIQRVNNYKFQAQYLQEPIVLGGQVIKREWFTYYSINKPYKYSKIVIAGDTAMSVKESSDRSCFIVGGVTADNRLHIIDFIVGRWDYPTLKQKIISLWNRWTFKDLNKTSASNLCIEDKASGIQLLQELRRYGIPLTPLKADKDKLTRVESVLEYIAAGLVMLPENESYGYNPEILNEVESFTRDDSHTHDDITDSLTYLVQSTIARRQVSILEVL